MDPVEKMEKALVTKKQCKPVLPFCPVHNNIMMLHNVLHCVATASTLVETQCNARIDSDPILVFLYVAFLRQIVKNR